MLPGMRGSHTGSAAHKAVSAAAVDPGKPPRSAGSRRSRDATTWKLPDFIVLEELYRATNGFVHHVRHRPSGKEFVLKGRTDAELGRHKDILHEVRLLTRLRHPNIIRCYGYFWNDSHSCLYAARLCFARVVGWCVCVALA